MAGKKESGTAVAKEEGKKHMKEPAKEAKKERKAEQQKAQKPAQERKPEAAKSKKDPWTVLKHPHLAEKSMNMVELDNKLTFIVRRDATKAEIKEAIENLFSVKVLAVQTEITRMGAKKAYAKLAPGFSAGEIASRMGMV